MLSNSHADFLETLDMLSEYCRWVRVIATLYLCLWLRYSEFLIHAADVEGLCRGIDEELVAS